MAGGDAIELQLGNWIVRDSMFVLTSCPLGHQLINTVDAKRAVSTNDTLFAHDAQRCKACEPSTYIIDPLMPCQPCPQGASCPGPIELCRMLRRVGLLEASDICLACGDGVHGAPLVFHVLVAAACTDADLCWRRRSRRRGERRRPRTFQSKLLYYNQLRLYTHASRDLATGHAISPDLTTCTVTLQMECNSWIK